MVGESEKPDEKSARFKRLLSGCGMDRVVATMSRSANVPNVASFRLWDFSSIKIPIFGSADDRNCKSDSHMHLNYCYGSCDLGDLRAIQTGSPWRLQRAARRSNQGNGSPDGNSSSAPCIN